MSEKRERVGSKRHERNEGVRGQRAGVCSIEVIVRQVITSVVVVVVVVASI